MNWRSARRRLQKDSDSKEAEADAAYEIQRQEQERTIQTATVNAPDRQSGKRSGASETGVLVQEQALEAEVNKKADADRYAVEQKAAADLAKRQREAEAKKYEMEKKRGIESTGGKRGRGNQGQGGGSPLCIGQGSSRYQGQR